MKNRVHIKTLIFTGDNEKQSYLASDLLMKYVQVHYCVTLVPLSGIVTSPTRTGYLVCTGTYLYILCTYQYI
jgi:hypothetical protein